MLVEGQWQENLVDKVVECLHKSEDNRILIAVAGVPGSGKSTVANSVASRLNKDKNINCKVVGMDGYHLYRTELAEMEDPTYAFKRRGAPFTFDSDGFVAFIKQLRESCKLSGGKRPVIKAPSFDHKLKDPTPDDIIIQPEVQVVIIEGLYTLLSDEPWCQISKLVDQTWFVKVDSEVARERLAKRHLEAGIEPSIEAAYNRVDNNDSLNGDYILHHLILHIDYIID